MFKINPTRPLSEASHAYLVQELHTTSLPIVVITVAQASLAALIDAHTDGWGFRLLAAFGLLTGIGRLSCNVLFRLNAPIRNFRRWEFGYAAGAAITAAVIGSTSAWTFLSVGPTSQLLGTALLYMYCAGLVARVSIRPWICVTCLAVAVLPVVVAMAIHWNPTYLGLCLLTLAALAGGLEATFHINKAVRGQLVAKDELLDMVHSDALTGLPNRVMLNHFLQASLKTTDRHAVLFIDLDRFKQVNDQFGHDVGDRLLCLVANRLTQLIRRSDLVARLGGDEFVVVEAGVTSNDEAEFLARRIIRELNQPFEIGEKVVSIGATIGIAFAPDHGADAATLLQKSDGALYDGKRNAKGSVRLALG